MPLGHVHVTVVLILLLYCLLPTCTIYFCHRCGILLAILGYPYEPSAYPWFGIFTCTGGRPITGEARAAGRPPEAGAMSVVIAAARVAATMEITEDTD